MDMNETGIGGVKEVVVLIKERRILRLKYESGVHRQRVPETESSGRIHTSAATVAVLPEVEMWKWKSIPTTSRVDVFRSSETAGRA